MSTTVASILERVRRILQDETEPYRWSTDELVDWMSEGEVGASTLKNDAYSVTTDVTLVLGERQQVPADGIRLLAAYRNTTSGRAVRSTSLEMMDHSRPSWRADAADSEVRNIMTDPLDPRVFYVWPPSDSTAEIQVCYAAIPPALSESGNLNVPDRYATAIMHFAVSRAYLKETEQVGPSAAQEAARHYSAYLMGLGIQPAKAVGASGAGG